MYSVDTVTKEDGSDNIHNNLHPTEFLNSLNVQGFPLYKLELKLNASVMFLKNLDISSGLCNGTTLQILSTNHKVLKVKITNGSHIGNIGLIPRIDLNSSESSLPFRMKRWQFPIRLCFAMTINKAQSRSINNLGVYLPKAVFSHGQLYVALSRAELTYRTKVMFKIMMENIQQMPSTTKY